MDVRRFGLSRTAQPLKPRLPRPVRSADAIRAGLLPGISRKAGHVSALGTRNEVSAFRGHRRCDTVQRVGVVPTPEEKRPVSIRPLLIALLLVSTGTLIPTTNALAFDPTCPAPDPAQVANGATYQLVPTANYESLSIDNQVGDDTDLTDGCFVRASHAREESVAWQRWPAVQIEVDLAAPGCASNPLECWAISEIRIDIQDRKGVAGIWCPLRARFEVSDDGVEWHQVGNYLRPATYPDGAACGPDGPDDVPNDQFNFWVSSGPLQTRGALARITVYADGTFVMADEVEVWTGVHSPELTNYQDFSVALDALGSEWRLFEGDPWAAEGPTVVPDASTVGPVQLAAARNDVASTSFAITNPTQATIVLAASVTSLQGPGGAQISGAALDLRHAHTALNLLFDKRADALAVMPAAGVPAPPRQVSHLWLDIQVPPEARPGLYEGQLEVNCLAGPCSGTLAMPIELDVRSYALPGSGSSSAIFFDWARYLADDPLSPTFSDELAAFGATRQSSGQNGHVNDFNALTGLPVWQDDLVQGLDFGPLDEDIAAHDQSRLHVMALLRNPALHFQGTACYPSPAWDAAYTALILAIRDHLEGSAGLLPSQFAIQTVDEPSDGRTIPGYGDGACPDLGRTRLELFEDAARLIRAVDPSILIWANVTETNIPRLQGIANEGLVDIWVPLWSHIIGGDPALAAFYAGQQAAGRTVWSYNGPDIRRTHGDPYTDGRLTPWEVFRSGLQGWAYWALFSPSRDGSAVTTTWNAFDGSGTDFATIYLGPEWDPQAPVDLEPSQRVIPSRRLASLRRGFADYRSFEALRALIALRQSQPVYADAVAAAEATLQNDVAYAVDHPEDRGLAASVIDTVGDHIEALATECNDGIDNDGDGAVDLADSQCLGDLMDDREAAGGGACGLGFELLPFLTVGALVGRHRWTMRTSALRSAGQPMS